MTSEFFYFLFASSILTNAFLIFMLLKNLSNKNMTMRVVAGEVKASDRMRVVAGAVKANGISVAL